MNELPLRRSYFLRCSVGLSAWLLLWLSLQFYAAICCYISSFYKVCVLFISDKKIAPKAVSDIKLINAGKILENSKTVGQCQMPFGELQKAIITMHVVVQPSVTKRKSGKYS